MCGGQLSPNEKRFCAKFGVLKCALKNDYKQKLLKKNTRNFYVYDLSSLSACKLNDLVTVYLPDCPPATVAQPRCDLF